VSELPLRAPMRARTVDAPPGAGADHGIERGLVAIGEPLDRVPETLDDAVAATAEQHGPKAARMLDRFAALPEGSVVWTQDSAGLFHRGAIAGPWTYDASAEGLLLGLVNARAAAWEPEPFTPDDVPAAVAATFARGGRNLQAIH
jgi:hypothetical protein